MRCTSAVRPKDLGIMEWMRSPSAKAELTVATIEIDSPASYFPFSRFVLSLRGPHAPYLSRLSILLPFTGPFSASNSGHDRGAYRCYIAYEQRSSAILEMALRLSFGMLAWTRLS